jgi:hypothetical protein
MGYRWKSWISIRSKISILNILDRIIFSGINTKHNVECKIRVIQGEVP